jgi:XTP/dITP diphosphohydrolase
MSKPINICLASNNQKKLEELRALLPAFSFLSLSEIGCQEELPETGDTLHTNSLEKAQFVADRYRVSCIADDSGLEVDALDGAPGVYSARFAGPQRSDTDNMALLLKKLAGVTDRSARFRTVITLILNGAVHQFEGTIEGHILHTPSGTSGFGYDPIFCPENHERSFAEMSAAEKNAISHRGKAVGLLADFLKNL